VSIDTWPANAIDTDIPNSARVFDALLGDAHNFAADRALAARLLAAVPGLTPDIYAERHFQYRAVQFCLDSGIRQFLDLGSGIPSVGNACDIILSLAPDARVICVDVDPVVVAFTAHRLRGNDRAAVVEADLRRPGHLLNHPEVTGRLNLDQPIAVLLVSVLHLVADADDPWAIVAQLRDRLAPGSHLVISHAAADRDAADMATLRRLTEREGLSATMRTREQVHRLFAGLSLVEPGLVWAPAWRPDPGEDDHGQAGTSRVLAGVGVISTPSRLPRDGRKPCVR
jgi:SAM-dependent methyltransferase